MGVGVGAANPHGGASFPSGVGSGPGRPFPRRPFRRFDGRGAGPLARRAPAALNSRALMLHSQRSLRFPGAHSRLRPGIGLALAAVFAVSPLSPLAASGQDTATATVEVGQPAPDFELKDARGESYRLSALLEKGPVVIEFFRSGGW